MSAAAKPPATVHVIGAGLAGLACALRCAGAGARVALYEATDHGGGRARSLKDTTLGRSIDNGNHLILSGNAGVWEYLREAGAAESLRVAPNAVFPFLDLETGARWAVRPNAGRIPWWIFDPARRVPETTAADYLAALKFAVAPRSATVADCLDTQSAAYARFWRPLCVAVLNIAPEEGAARLLWPVIRLTFGKGAAACRPCVAREGLTQSFVTPAFEKIKERGGTIRFNRRVKRLDIADGRAAALDFGDETVRLAEGDKVVLAVPPEAAAQLLPGLEAPKEGRPIVNAHFLLPHEPEGLPYDSHLIGFAGGVSEWIFVRGDVASVTVSAAVGLAEEDAWKIAGMVWPEVVQALGLPEGSPLPAHRIIKEKRATFAQTPAQAARRPGTRTHVANLFLAGDWTDTGLPATLEGAVKSGFAAARAVLTR